jgi:hypothetical protein
MTILTTDLGAALLALGLTALLVALTAAYAAYGNKGEGDE